MYNTDIPTRAELPTSRQLLRSTIIAIAAAATILVGIVLPSEYGIDPTGVGRALGLAEMGEIKTQLAKEAEADRAADRAGSAPAQGVPTAPTPSAGDKRSSLLETIFAPFAIGSAAAQTATAARSDEMTVTLKPNEGAEVKLQMKKGAKANFSWKAEGGVVNFDTHGEPDSSPSSTHSYKKGRSVAADEGVLEARFDGNHGWFWRNRTSRDVTITLRATGEYLAMKRVL
jgi:hypothetical protein